MEIHLSGHRKMPGLTRLPSLHLDRCNGYIKQALPEARTNFDLLALVRDRLASLLKHMVAVQHIAVGRGDDLGIENGQPELVQHGSAMRKDEVLVAGVDEDFRAASQAVGAQQDQRQFVGSASCDGKGVPDNFPKLATHKVIVGNHGPNLFDGICRHPKVNKQF